MIHARGLCTRCYMSLGGYSKKQAQDDMFHLYERTKRTYAERVEDAKFLIDSGESVAGAAARMGLSKDYVQELLSLPSSVLE